jgi:dihydrofolate synthase/folylpolyglutamate synthase
MGRNRGQTPNTDRLNLADPIDWLFSLEQFGIKFGLDNIRALVDELGHPESAFKSVHIAGTNGKGSVAAMVDAALQAAGHRSARYTSPHLVDLTERFVVDGRAVERAMLAAAAGDIRSAVERLRAHGRLPVQPTFFEVTTAIAFELFRRAGVDVAVCEVGLGGRLDATNVLQPVATAITTIGFDHQQYLGHTLADIAREKAGIIKGGVPVVVGKLDPAAHDVIERVATDLGAPLIAARRGVTVSSAAQDMGSGSSRIFLRTPSHEYGDLRIALPGLHQIDNAIVAVRLLEILHQRGIAVPPHAVAAGLERVVWPGRLELRRLADGREALLDAAHNPDGAAALAAYLGTIEKVRRPVVFGAMRDKDAAGMLAALAPVASVFVLTRASNARSADPSSLATAAEASAPGVRVVVEAAPRDALAAAWSVSPRIVVAGSIFLLGDVMIEINRS